MVLFSADWAEQCVQIIDVMKQLVKLPEYKDTQFLNVPAEDLSEVSMKHQVCYD